MARGHANQPPTDEHNDGDLESIIDDIDTTVFQDSLDQLEGDDGLIEQKGGEQASPIIHPTPKSERSSENRPAMKKHFFTRHWVVKDIVFTPGFH